MQKYAKLINEKQVEFPPKNKGNIINYNLNIEEMTKDGYKPFVEDAKEIGKSYTITYRETETEIIEVAVEIVPDPIEVLNQAKQQKIQENDNARDIVLNSGVVYKEVLFDSDTDQKTNILGAVLQMSDTDTIEWFGMNNYSLACTKEDLLNIGGLITQLHTYCWTENARIKNEIREANTIEEVNSIEIDYNGGDQL